MRFCACLLSLALLVFTTGQSWAQNTSPRPRKASKHEQKLFAEAVHELLALNYHADESTPDGSPGVIPSLRGMVWTRGLRLTAVPSGMKSYALFVHDSQCPDSLRVAFAACVLHNVVAVTVIRADSAAEGELVLVPRTVIGPASGPLEPWPATAAVLEHASKVALAGRGRVATPPDQPYWEFHLR